MPLSVQTPIRASDVMEVKNLKEGKIFLLTGRDGSKLVIKGEAGVTGDATKAAAPVVKAIDALGKMKPLVQSEVLELQKFVRASQMYTTFIKQTMGDLVTPANAQEEQTISELEDLLEVRGVASAMGRTDIAKMNYVGMSTLSVVLDVEGKPADDESWDEARGTFAKFIKALNKSGGLERLGEILAADFFLGNNDRFTTSGSGMQVKLYEEKKRLKVLVNLGNVILVKEKKGTATRPGMLDYMDPAGDLKDLTLTAAAYQGKWEMPVLLDKASRSTLAKNLVEDLEYILKPEKSLFGMNKLGGSSAHKRVESGITNGLRKIKKTLAARRAKLPPLYASFLSELEKARI
jgi:hypothetical protein